MTPNKPKQKKVASIAMVRANTLKNLKTGRYSKHLNQFLVEKGLPTMDTLKGLPVNSAEEITRKIALMEAYNERIQPFIELYASTTHRGMRTLDKLVDIRQKLLEREYKLKTEGKDPLADPMVFKWHSLELDMMKFLEKLKFDQAKATVDFALRKKGLDEEELTLADVKGVEE